MSRDKFAKLSAESKPATGPNGEDAQIAVHLEGSVNGLLNAWVQMTARLFGQIIEQIGEDEAMGLYAAAQMETLALLGVDLGDDEEDEE